MRNVFLERVAEQRAQQQLEQEGQAIAREANRELVERERITRRRDEFLGLALSGFTKTGAAMATTDRECTKGCGTKLGPNNKSGVCSGCQVKGDGASPRAPRAAKPSRGGASDVRRRFKQITDGLNLDGDGLVEEFMAGWLSKVRAPGLDDASPDAALGGD